MYPPIPVESITMYLHNTKMRKVVFSTENITLKIERMRKSSNRELEVYDYDSYYLKLKREREQYELKTTIE